MRIEFLIPVACLAGTAIVMPLLLRSRLLPLDLPNHRSSHQRAVPRSGGLGIWAGWAIALVILEADWRWLAPAAGLAVLSYLDDRRGLPVAVRFAAQALCAGASVIWLLPDASLLLRVCLIFVTVWAMNLYNFMDGSDGLAVSTAACGFGVMAVAAGLGKGPELALLLASLAASALAFDAYNWSPARVFLGDVGSVPLGFLAAVLGLLGVREGLWEAWLPALAFLPFIVDASLTLARRALRGERVWHAHRDHAYQRLIRLGWSHARTARLYVALQAGGGLLALAAQLWWPEAGPWAFLAWSAVLAAAFASVQWQWMRAHREGHHAHS